MSLRIDSLIKNIRRSDFVRQSHDFLFTGLASNKERGIFTHKNMRYGDKKIPAGIPVFFAYRLDLLESETNI